MMEEVQEPDVDREFSRQGTLSYRARCPGCHASVAISWASIGSPEVGAGERFVIRAWQCGTPYCTGKSATD